MLDPWFNSKFTQLSLRLFEMSKSSLIALRTGLQSSEPKSGSVANLRYEDVTSAHTEVVKVLNVGKASPAEYAGLKA